MDPWEYVCQSARSPHTPAWELPTLWSEAGIARLATSASTQSEAVANSGHRTKWKYLAMRMMIQMIQNRLILIILDCWMNKNIILKFQCRTLGYSRTRSAYPSFRNNALTGYYWFFLGDVIMDHLHFILHNFFVHLTNTNKWYFCNMEK